VGPVLCVLLLACDTHQSIDDPLTNVGPPLSSRADELISQLGAEEAELREAATRAILRLGQSQAEAISYLESRVTASEKIDPEIRDRLSKILMDLEDYRTAIATQEHRELVISEAWTGFAFISPGRIISADGDGSLVVSDLKRRSVLSRSNVLRGTEISWVAGSADRRMIACLTQGHGLVFLDASTLELATRVHLPKGEKLLQGSFSASSASFAAPVLGFGLRVWDCRTGKALASVTEKGIVSVCSVADSLFLFGKSDGDLGVFDYVAQRILAQKRLTEGRIWSLAGVSGTECAIVGDSNGRIHLVNWQTFEVTSHFDRWGGITACDVNSDGTLVAVGGSPGEAVILRRVRGELRFGCVLDPRQGYSCARLNFDPGDPHFVVGILMRTAKEARTMAWTLGRPKVVVEPDRVVGQESGRSLPNEEPSTVSDKRCRIFIANSRNAPVTIFLVDYEGKPERYRSLSPGFAFEVEIRVGYRWVAYAGDTRLETYVSPDGGGTWELK
jgi:hypothetical protein